jgi:small-conductance mechanosensitive channel
MANGIYAFYGRITIFNLISVILTVIFAIFLATFIKIKLKTYLSNKIPEDIRNILIKIIYYTIILIAVISALSQVGINVSGLFVAGGIAGLIIGFASQSIVSNLVSGLFIMFERPVKIGDQIEIDGISGFVEDIHLISTIIRTYDGIFVRIPNEKVFTSKIKNYVTNVVRRFEYTVGISYSDDAEKRMRLLWRIKKEIEDAGIEIPFPQRVVWFRVEKSS